MFIDCDDAAVAAVLRAVLSTSPNARSYRDLPTDAFAVDAAAESGAMLKVITVCPGDRCHARTRGGSMFCASSRNARLAQGQLQRLEQLADLSLARKLVAELGQLVQLDLGP